MANTYPQLGKLKVLIATLKQLREFKLAIGHDGRNRAMLGAFGTKTSRNAPKATEFILGPAGWVRSFILASEGWGIADLDWEQAEVGIAAALSKDEALMETYIASGFADCYIAFGVKTGMTVEEAVRVRQSLKACLLGMQLGMGAQTLALRINKPLAFARELVAAHRKAYPVFWKWSDGAVDTVMQLGTLKSGFGWPIHRAYKDWAEDNRPNSFRNFPMQSTCAAMMRKAANLTIERGVELVATLHDALMIHAPLDHLDEVITITREAMNEASRLFLHGFELRTSKKEARYPDHYLDEEDRTDAKNQMWDLVWRIVEEIEREETEMRA